MNKTGEGPPPLLLRASAVASRMRPMMALARLGNYQGVLLLLMASS